MIASPAGAPEAGRQNGVRSCRTEVPAQVSSVVSAEMGSALSCCIALARLTDEGTVTYIVGQTAQTAISSVQIILL